MTNIFNIIEKYTGGKCFYTNTYSLDHVMLDEYQDKDEKFNTSKVFETNRNAEKRKLVVFNPGMSIFKFFLDGSRRTYKIVDFASTDGKYLPIVAGQIGTAVCFRENKSIKNLHLKLKKTIFLINYKQILQ